MHRPFVFLPGSLFAGKAEHLSHVLCHELTHLRTQHPMQLFCQKFAQCLLWFHPLMWISSNRASLVREFVCDDASVKHLGSTTAYLRALIATAEETQKHQEETLAISRRNDDLMERVRRLAQLNEHPTHCHRVPVISVFMICTLACSQVWLPLDPLASDRSIWSPWPTWSADVLHEVNVSVRDYEIFQHGHQLHEWIEITNKSHEPFRSW
jgi:beta-lactamase regulating signal transducer with metallopeptidase domain